MIELLKGTSMTDTLQNLIIVAGAIMIAIFVINALMKSPQLRPIVTYSLATIFIIGSAFCGYSLVKGLTTKSSINGSSVTLNSFSKESFKYHVSNIELYGEYSTGDYVYSKELTPIEDFNGNKYNYEVVLNDYKLFDADISAGGVEASITVDFYDTAGERIVYSKLNISVTFYTDRTELKLKTTGELNELYLENYFKLNGFRLSINRIGEN